MKRRLSLLLCAALLCGLSLPALGAAAPADAQLAAVTAKVKETLGIDTQAYDSFYGDKYENELAPTWRLSWSGPAGALYVEATEDGAIISFSRSDDGPSSASGGGRLPSFPAGSPEEATAAARTFLDKVLDGTLESVALKEPYNSGSLNASSYRFSGLVLLNGLPSPLNYSLSVRAADNQVTHFSRDVLPTRYMGGVPSAKPAVTAAQAGQTLSGPLSLRLEYVLSDDGKTAVLRYLPDSIDEYYVDAATGRLVNLTELFGNMRVTGGAGQAAMDTAMEGSEANASKRLTEAELAGIEKLEGVLDKEALDAKLRAMTALGLRTYTLSSVSYMVARDTGEDDAPAAVTASLRYSKQVGGAIWSRIASVDARTGDLLDLYSSAWLPEKSAPARAVTARQAQTAAEAFLAELCPDQFGQTELYQSTDALENDRVVNHSLTYAQKENGYFYTGNSISVGVDATDGSISHYSKHFDDAVTFDSPDGIISAQDALDAWLATYDVTLSYLAVPQKLDLSDPGVRPLIDLGYSYFYTLKLGYSLTRDTAYLGIDAKTGSPVPAQARADTGLSYSDLEGHWAKGQITRLARYDVGYAGGTFQPGAA
ncbi:MAG: hypothetical protein GX585_03230, partial [Clostridiales bacterium]|nr:hypothetical protein [Clostridiales bacterium]